LFSNEKERLTVYFFVLIFKKNFALSHIPQRKEKDCLNCGTTVLGKYCHVCGQENVEPKETLWHMVTHFFNDITHFDGSFFTSLKDLLFKPGFLSKEYMKGRRASYLHPVRMYVFTSAIFFLLFFSFFQPKDAIDLGVNKPLDRKERTEYIRKWETRLKKETENILLKEKIALLKDTSRIATTKDILGVEEHSGLTVNFADREYNSLEEYDSVQKTLPPSKRAGWLGRRFAKFGINITRQFREDPEGATTKLVEGVLHRLPYMLFVSLPLFALILKLVYVRRKQFYFADHGVFTIHLYVFSFLLLLLVFCTDKLKEVTGINDFEYFTAVLFLLLIFYLYRAMLTFYGQGRWKTFFKFLFVAFWSFIMMVILFILFMLFSAATL
jgi:hypothetical protein